MNQETFDIVGISKEQLIVINKALELYERLSLRQIEYVGEVVAELHHSSIPDHITAQKLCDIFKMVDKSIGFEKRLGVGNNEQPQRGKIAYDLFCVFRQMIAKVDNHHSFSVYLDDPLNYSGTILPKVVVHGTNNSTK